MPTTLPPEGYVAPRLADVRASLRATARNVFGAGVALDSDSVIGQLVDVHALAIADLYSLTQAVYDALDPGKAEGMSLDALSEIVGVFREPETHSAVVLVITGTPATTIPAGSIYRTPEGARWITQQEVIIPGGGEVSVNAEAEDPGPVDAGADSITEAVTVVGGVDTITNPSTPTLGRFSQTDVALRQARRRSLRVTGAGSDGAIAARIEEMPEIDQAVCVSNRTSSPDALGIPPKGYRVIVWPDPAPDYPAPTPAALRVAGIIWETGPAGGGGSDGAQAYQVTDVAGVQQTVRFSPATLLPAHVNAALTTGPGYPLDGDDQVAAAIVATAADLRIGASLRLIRILSAVAQIEGVLGAVITAKAGEPPSGGDTADIEATMAEIIRIDADDVEVSS